MMLFAALVVSCSGNASGGGHSEPVDVDIDDVLSRGDGTKTVVSSPIAVSGNQSIVLKGLDGGKLYTIYSDGVEAIGSAKASPDVNSLGEWTYTFMIPEDRTELELDASDIGLADGGEFRIGDVAAPRLTFQDGEKGMVLGQDVSEPLYIKPDGSEYYEAFFSLDMDTIPDPTRLILNTYMTYGGPAYASRWFRFIDEYGAEISSINGNALIDLSGYDTVYLCARLVVSFPENSSAKLHLQLVDPGEIKQGTSSVLSGPSTYIIGPSSSPQVLSVDRQDGSGLGAFSNPLNARYTTTGKHFLHVFPIAMTDDRIFINIPTHSDPIMFDYSGPSTSAELSSADEVFSIVAMGSDTKTFSVDDGTAIFPVVFTGDLYGRTVALETDAAGEGVLGCAHVSGNGYSQDIISVGKPVQVSGERKLEYFYFMTSTGKACTFTLTVE